MNDKTKYILLLIIAFNLIFLVLAVVHKNLEFVFYSINFFLGVVILYLFKKQIGLTPLLALGFVLSMVLHMAGGLINTNGMRLYEFYFIEGVIKYDNITHFFGTFLLTIAGYNLLKYNFWNKESRSDYIHLFLVLVLGYGLGSLNEIIELMYSVSLGYEKEVGDYLNNALDLAFNFIGALAATLVIALKERKFI